MSATYIVMLQDQHGPLFFGQAGSAEEITEMLNRAFGLGKIQIIKKLDFEAAVNRAVCELRAKAKTVKFGDDPSLRTTLRLSKAGASLLRDEITVQLRF